MDRDYAIRTLLMTDVVGSTALWATRPAGAMMEAFERFEAIAQTAVEGQEGRIVRARGEGDSLFCVMPHPAAAARAAAALNHALDAEPWPDGLVLKVRAAIHCGPVHARDAALYGTMPNRCARLREIGHPGQILLSGAARSQIDPMDGVVLRDLGPHRLRDLDESENVYQVVAPGLAEEFPPLRSLTALRNNLPLQPTSFVGRAALRRDLQERLHADRLTTLAGAGGSGKTRLALQLGAESIEAFPDGVWFVELAEAVTESAVLRAVGDACGQRDLPDSGEVGPLAARLASQKRTLFVLDNAEQAVGPIGRVVAGLMAANPELRFLVTSREPLHLRGERVHRVPPMEAPPPGCADPEAVAGTEAGDLFVERARLRVPEFALRASNAAAVTEIIRRLDGIPLCLEMAAAHVDYLDIDEIARRLGDRFALLEGEDADAPARHRTMRETIAWQVDSLGDDERTLLKRLAAFAGGFPLDAAEAVGGGPPLDPRKVVRHLRALVDKSLVVAAPEEDGMRYRLLETIGQFAEEMPGESFDSTIRALFAWAAATVASCDGLLYGPRHRECLDRLDRRLPSIHRALDWGLTAGAAGVDAFALTLAPFWFHRGLYRLGRGFLERATQAFSTSVRIAELHSALGAFCNRLGESGPAEAAYRTALETPGITSRTQALCLMNLGIVLNDQGRYEEALQRYDEAIAAASFAAADHTLKLCRYNRGLVLTDLGRFNEAEAAFRSLADLYLAGGDRTLAARCLSNLGMIGLMRDDPESAVIAFRESLDATGDEMPIDHLIDLLIEVATIAARRGQRERAAFLFAAHRAFHDATGSRYSPRKERQAAWLEEVLPRTEEALRGSFAEGAKATPSLLRQAIDEVLKAPT